MHRLVLCLLVLPAAAAAGAAQDKAEPLAESKQQLRQFQKDQANRVPDQGAAGLKGLAPAVAAPSVGTDLPAAPPPPATGQDVGRDGKKGAWSANWLVDGYNQLDPRAPGKGRGAADPKDPLGRNAAVQGEAAPSARGTTYEFGGAAARGMPGKTSLATDPMLPFLKGWLANSPVKHEILDSLKASAADDAGLIAGSDEAKDALGAPENGARDGAPAFVLGKPIGQPAENPYLKAQGEEALAGVRQNPTPVAPLPAVQAAPSASLAAPVSTPSGADKRGSFKAPATKADDDKKYFPQLKRF